MADISASKSNGTSAAEALQLFSAGRYFVSQKGDLTRSGIRHTGDTEDARLCGIRTAAYDLPIDERGKFFNRVITEHYCDFWPLGLRQPGTGGGRAGAALLVSLPLFLLSCVMMSSLKSVASRA